MALIPVILEFYGVAKDANLSLTLTTNGASWALEGEGDGSSLGFSYNGLLLGEGTPSCITSIELTASVLEVRTSATATASAFTLTLMLDVQSEIESVQGYCTLNAGARVICQLGYDSPAVWRSGQFGAIIRHVPKDVRRVRFNLQRPPAGVPNVIDLMTEQAEPGSAYWCLNAGVSAPSGFILRTADRTLLPIRTFTVSNRKIVVITGAKATSDVWIEAYLCRIPSAPTTDSNRPGLQRFHLRATCDESVAVIAQVGAQRPRYLAASYSCFAF